MARRSEIDSAFDILLEEIDHAIDRLNQEGASAFSSRAYERAKGLTEKGQKMSELRCKVTGLREEWSGVIASVRPRRRKRKATRTQGERLKRGLRTPEDAFRAPILTALQEHGGGAPLGPILDRVGELMASTLNDHDRQPLPSTPKSARWRNTAAWTRAKMVREGLMAADSSHGVWEITAAGRQWLAEHRAQPQA